MHLLPNAASTVNQMDVLLVILLCLILFLLIWRHIAVRRKMRAEERHALRPVLVEREKIPHVNRHVSTTRIVPERKRISGTVPAKVLQERLAHRLLVGTLRGTLTTLPTIVARRAALLYQEQEGCSWQEACAFVYAFFEGVQEPQDKPRVMVDPVVTMLLVRTGYREDALRYFHEFSGADTDASVAAVDYIGTLIDANDTLFLEHQRREPDPRVLHFLLLAGHKSLAIRYYHDCTDVSLTDAHTIVEQISMDGLLTL